VEIKVPVAQNDTWKFEREAKFLFQFFEPRPNINIELPDLPEKPEKLDRGIFHYERANGLERWLVVMGGLPYKLDLNQLVGDPVKVREAHDKEVQAWYARKARYEARGREFKDPFPEDPYIPFMADEVKQLGKRFGILPVDIGDVDIAGSREGLEYTKKTKIRVRKAIEETISKYMEELRTIIDDESLSGFQRRLAVREFQSRVQLKLPEEDAAWGAASVKFDMAFGWRKDEPPTKYGVHGKREEIPFVRNFELMKPQSSYYHSNSKGPTLNTANTIRIHPGLRIWFHDTIRSTPGFKPVSGLEFFRTSSDKRDMVITRAYAGKLLLQTKKEEDFVSAKEAWDELDGFLRKHDLDGIPILRTSYLPWEKPRDPAEEKAKIEKQARKASQETRRKYNHTFFTLSPARGRHSTVSPESKRWIRADEDSLELGDDTVYVLLYRFYPLDSYRLLSPTREYRSFNKYRLRNRLPVQLEVVERHWGNLTGEVLEIPKIIGIKQTAKKPIDPKNLPGMSLEDWLQKTMKRLLRKKGVRKAINSRAMARRSAMRPRSKEELSALRHRLGKDHPIYVHFSQVYAACEHWATLDQDYKEAIKTFQSQILLGSSWEASYVAKVSGEERYQALLDRYPLLNTEIGGPGINALWWPNSSRADPWHNYVAMCDIY
jgi:hypothetical protein